jgi:hypothetical protein
MFVCTVAHVFMMSVLKLRILSESPDQATANVAAS